MRVTKTLDVLPTAANWKLIGFGLATTAIDPAPCNAAVEGLPVTPVPENGTERLPLKVVALVGVKLTDRKHEPLGANTVVEHGSNGKE